MILALSSILPGYVKTRHLEGEWQAFCVLRHLSLSIGEVCQSPLQESIKPIAVHGNTITISCASASAIQEFMLYKKQILQRLNIKLQEEPSKKFPLIEQIYYQP